MNVSQSVLEDRHYQKIINGFEELQYKTVSDLGGKVAYTIKTLEKNGLELGVYKGKLTLQWTDEETQQLIDDYEKYNGVIKDIYNAHQTKESTEFSTVIESTTSLARFSLDQINGKLTYLKKTGKLEKEVINRWTHAEEQNMLEGIESGLTFQEIYDSPSQK